MGSDPPLSRLAECERTVIRDRLPEPPRVVPEGAPPTRENLALVLEDVAQRRMVGRPLTWGSINEADLAAGAALTRHFAEPGDVWRAAWTVMVVRRRHGKEDNLRFWSLQRSRSPGAQVAALDVREWNRKHPAIIEPVRVVGVEVRAPDGRVWTFDATGEDGANGE